MCNFATPTEPTAVTINNAPYLRHGTVTPPLCTPHSAKRCAYVPMCFSPPSVQNYLGPSSGAFSVPVGPVRKFWSYNTLFVYLRFVPWVAT